MRFVFFVSQEWAPVEKSAGAQMVHSNAIALHPRISQPLRSGSPQYTHNRVALGGHVEWLLGLSGAGDVSIRLGLRSPVPVNTPK